jgi:hypothetical protein
VVLRSPVRIARNSIQDELEILSSTELRGRGPGARSRALASVRVVLIEILEHLEEARDDSVAPLPFVLVAHSPDIIDEQLVALLLCILGLTRLSANAIH